MTQNKTFLVWPDHSKRSYAKFVEAPNAEAAARSLFYKEHDNLNTLDFDDDGYSQVYFVTEPNAEKAQRIRAVFSVEVQTTILPEEQP